MYSISVDSNGCYSCTGACPANAKKFFPVGPSCGAVVFSSGGSCTGGVPSNAAPCSGSNSGLTFDIANTAVSACSGAKCEYLCTAGFTPGGGSCIPVQCSAQSLALNATTAAFSLTNGGQTGSGTCAVGSGSASAACSLAGSWGAPTGTCCPAGQSWSGGSCVALPCSAQSLSLNGTTAAFSMTNAGLTGIGTCASGAGSASAACSMTGTWGSASGTCCSAGQFWSGAACANLQCSAQSLSVNGTTATFPLTNAGQVGTATSCASGSGTATASCTLAGSWGSATGTCCPAGQIWGGGSCVLLQCPAQSLPLNGRSVAFSATNAGSSRTVSCYYGSASATCASNGIWGTATGPCCPATEWLWGDNLCHACPSNTPSNYGNPTASCGTLNGQVISRGVWPNILNGCNGLYSRPTDQVYSLCNNTRVNSSSSNWGTNGVMTWRCYNNTAEHATYPYLEPGVDCSCTIVP